MSRTDQVRVIWHKLLREGRIIRQVGRELSLRCNELRVLGQQLF
jgi:hypothetical protein